MDIEKSNKAYFGNHKLNIAIGIVGLLLFIVGTLLPGTYEQKHYFLYGAIFLTISSFLEKNTFFTVLEIIIVIDAVLSFLGLSVLAISIITFIIIIITIIYFVVKGEFKEKYLIAGTIGLIFLGLGVGINHPVFYTIGGFFVALYSLFSVLKGYQIAYLFLILNTIFTITSAIGAYQWLVR
jgi:hypothetical protein